MTKQPDMHLTLDRIPSPVGEVLVVTDADGAVAGVGLLRLRSPSAPAAAPPLR